MSRLKYVNAEHERNTHLQYKQEYCNKNKIYWDRYFALINNLDGDSVETINQILKRIEALFACEDAEMDIFSEEEKHQMSLIQDNFKSKIFRLDKELFSYKNYFLPKNYFDTNVYYYKCGCELFRSPDKICSGDIIDAGAFIGDSSLLFAKMTKGTVYAWEAIGENCEYIRKTIQLNKLNNVEIVNKAIGSKSGEASIGKNKNLNWSTMVPYATRKYDNENFVEMQSIDEFVEETKVNVSLIKLHVEGMESEAIKGAVKTLKTQKPALIIHIHHTPTDFWEIKPFIENLDVGYRFKIYKPVNGNILTGTILLCEV